MNDDAINMVNKRHSEYQASVERALKDSEEKLRNRVSNDKGVVIGVVTFDLNFFNNIKNRLNYIFDDRKRAQEFIAKFAVAGFITMSVIGGAMNIREATQTRKETEDLAKSISDQKIMTALETPSLEDDQNILDYYLSSVPKDATAIGPNDRAVYDQELRKRLENLQAKIESLRSSETLGVDVASLTNEYKKEYEAIVHLMEEKSFYFDYDKSLEEAKSQKL